MSDETKTPVGNLDTEAIRRAAEDMARTNGMLAGWAETEGKKVLRQMELKGSPFALDIHWPKIKKGWMGGFVSGVVTGFGLGYKSANKLTTGFLNNTVAAVAGMEREAIEDRNKTLREFLTTAINEAVDSKGCDETKQEILNRLYAEFATPMPESPQAAVEKAGQERLPL